MQMEKISSVLLIQLQLTRIELLVLTLEGSEPLLDIPVRVLLTFSPDFAVSKYIVA